MSVPEREAGAATTCSTCEELNIECCELKLLNAKSDSEMEDLQRNLEMTIEKLEESEYDRNIPCLGCAGLQEELANTVLQHQSDITEETVARGKEAAQLRLMSAKWEEEKSRKVRFVWNLPTKHMQANW